MANSKDKKFLFIWQLFLGSAALLIVMTQADNGDNRDEQDGEQVIDDEQDDVAENKVDEE
jgi:hypothetical protein